MSEYYANFRADMTIFTKPFRVKTNTQMKGSDKKKLKAALKKSFPALSDEHLSDLLPMKEEIVVSKIFTFTEESVLLYIHNKNTVFFEMEKEKQFFPSVYTLWKIPDLFPTFTTMPGESFVFYVFSLTPYCFHSHEEGPYYRVFAGNLQKRN